MQIYELGLRPSLIEDFPVSLNDEEKKIAKAERKVARRLNLNQRKKKLKAIMAQTGLTN